MNSATSKRVLVVDDDPQILTLLRTILEGAGYTVFDAHNGREAMIKVRDHDIDLMITDIIMPEQEGVETITRLKRDFPAVKVIAMSGAAGGRYLKVAELLGAHAALLKPFDAGQLLDAIKRVMG